MFLGDDTIDFCTFCIEMICDSYLLIIWRLKYHQTGKLGIVQSLPYAIAHIIEYFHYIIGVEQKVEIPRIDLFDRTKVDICRGNNAMFLNQSCAQAALIILKVSGPNDDIPSFNNIVSIETFR